MEKFLEGTNDWCNHRPLLYLALEETAKGDVLEMGCGHGSTPILHEYCKENKRKLISIDNNNEWLEKFTELESAKHKLFLAEDWEKEVDTHSKKASVVLIDHSPGEDRGSRLAQLKDFKGIIVCHDSEPRPCGGNYGWDFSAWKYVVHVKTPMNGDTNGCWATAVSNEFDITKWDGKEMGGYLISK